MPSWFESYLDSLISALAFARLPPTPYGAIALQQVAELVVRRYASRAGRVGNRPRLAIAALSTIQFIALRMWMSSNGGLRHVHCSGTRAVRPSRCAACLRAVVLAQAPGRRQRRSRRRRRSSPRRCGPKMSSGVQLIVKRELVGQVLSAFGMSVLGIVVGIATRYIFVRAVVPPRLQPAL